MCLKLATFVLLLCNNWKEILRVQINTNLFSCSVTWCPVFLAIVLLSVAFLEEIIINVTPCESDSQSQLWAAARLPLLPVRLCCSQAWGWRCSDTLRLTISSGVCCSVCPVALWDLQPVCFRLQPFISLTCSTSDIPSCWRKTCPSHASFDLILVTTEWLSLHIASRWAQTSD